MRSIKDLETRNIQNIQQLFMEKQLQLGVILYNLKVGECEGSEQAGAMGLCCFSCV